MKLSKTEAKKLVEIILIWIFLNITFNMFGLWFSKLLKATEFTYLENIVSEFVKPIFIQSLIFGVCLSIAFRFLKNKKFSFYLFAIVQFVIFHIIFFLNLKIHHGLHFVSTFDNLGLQYLGLNGQYLVDVLYLYFPINGFFENNMFKPDNLLQFYSYWVLFILVYYIALTWISIKTGNYFFKSKTEIQSKDKTELSEKQQ